MSRWKEFLTRHGKTILVLFLVYVVLMLILVFLAAGPQDDPFGYR